MRVGDRKDFDVSHLMLISIINIYTKLLSSLELDTVGSKEATEEKRYAKESIAPLLMRNVGSRTILVKHFLFRQFPGI